MKRDMSGAAAVFAAVLAAARLGLRANVTGWLALAENMPSGTALRPGDVLRMNGGRTVEVRNTAAEGRLVLADALVRAAEDGPEAIVDVATLTAAMKLALGHRTIGVPSDHDAFARSRPRRRRAGRRAGLADAPPGRAARDG
jgi:leucyl aminopeptidase